MSSSPPRHAGLQITGGRKISSHAGFVIQRNRDADLQSASSAGLVTASFVSGCCGLQIRSSITPDYKSGVTREDG